MVSVGLSADNKRATIGLALGGGGAKGDAHIGVLHKLEELQIPIDYIAGTSMGSVIAGLYASGMSPDEIEELMVSINWWDILDNKSSRRDMSFRRKAEQHRYLFNFELGLKGFRLVLPRGISSGQKLNNLLVKVNSSVAEIEDFDNLNIPLRCVATDLRTASSIVLGHGDLAQAQRASMAVPGMFSPVIIDDYILVDGGLLNNIPVDVVKNMGADIVIAVDVSGAGDWSGGDKNFDTVSEVLEQTYLIMQRTEQDKRLKLADTIISPDTSEFGASAFHKIVDIIPLGYEAAVLKKDALSKYSVSNEEYSDFLSRQRRDKSETASVGNILVSGNDVVDRRIILNRINTKPNEPIDYEQIKRDISKIYALGSFEYVLYNLIPREGSNNVHDVEFNVSEKAWGPGYLKFGLRLEVDFDNHAYWGFLVNYTRQQLNALDGEWRLDIQGGSSSGVRADLYQPLAYSGSLFVSPMAEYISSKENVFEGDDTVADYDVARSIAGFDIGSAIKTYAELRVGYRIESVDAKVDIGSSELPNLSDTIGAINGRFMIDTLDDSYFPRKGIMFKLTGLLARDDLGSDVSYELVEMRFEGVTSYNKHTLLSRIRFGHSFGSDVPAYDFFTLGGISSFGGLARGQLRGPYVGVASLGYRYRLGRLPPGIGDGLFFLLRGDAGNVWQDDADINTDDLRYGLSTGLMADTPLGPISLVYGLADKGSGSVYLSIGATF